MPHGAAAANRALLVEKGQWWRLVTSLFASDSFAEGLLSWFLLYKFRLFERQMGCVAALLRLGPPEHGGAVARASESGAVSLALVLARACQAAQHSQSRKRVAPRCMGSGLC